MLDDVVQLSANVRVAAWAEAGRCGKADILDAGSSPWGWSTKACFRTGCQAWSGRQCLVTEEGGSNAIRRALDVVRSQKRDLGSDLTQSALVWENDHFGGGIEQLGGKGRDNRAPALKARVCLLTAPVIVPLRSVYTLTDLSLLFLLRSYLFNFFSY